MADNSFTNNDQFSWVTGFLKSAVEGVPEVVGITPSTDTLQWRQDHPVSGLVSEFAGLAVPYAGWEVALLKGAKYLPQIKKFMDAVGKVGDLTAKPVSTAFKREVIKFAPFEAGRLGLSQAVGDNPFSQELMNSTLNLALAGGVSGLLHGVAAAGKRDPTLSTMFPGIDIAAPAALQARHMKSLIDGGAISPELMPRALREMKTLQREARTEELGKNLKYVGALQGDPVSHPPLRGLEQQLNRWFRPTDQPGNKSLQIRAFANAADKNFAKAEDWINEADLAGIGGPTVPDPADPNILHHVDPPWTYGQYFRSISFNPTKAAQLPKVVDNKITKGFENIGNNWFMIREADDGMFVMAKKYSGEPGKAEPTDKWLLFKTDQPSKFVPENQAWADAMVGMSRWMPEATVQQDYGLVGNVLKNFVDEVPFRNYQGIAHPAIMSKIIERLGPQGDNELAHRLKESFREYLTPRIYQFTKAPRANWISQASKVAYDYANNMVNELVNGKIGIDAGKQLFFGHLSKAQGELGLPPLREVAQSLSKEEFTTAFENYIRKGVPLEKAQADHAAGDISENTLNFLSALQAIDNVTTTNVSLAEKAVGKQPTEWLKGHYGWSHVWEGDTRIPILNEKSELVFLAGGPNKKAAQAMAKSVLDKNPNWKLGDAYSKTDRIASMAAQAQKPVDEIISNVVLSPSWTLERAGVGGYKWFNTTPDVEDFLKDIENNLLSRWRYQANIVTDDMLTPQLDRLKREDPAAYKQVIERMNADAGIQGQWGRAINRAVDEHLAPILGNESASKIVGITNTALFNLQLGAMNLAFPAVNLLTFIQTSLPEIAFALSAPAERLAPYYSHFLAGGTRGPIGGMAVLHPLKIAFRALGEMRAPGQDVADAVAWAMNNRTLDPKMVEGYIGESTTKVKDIFKLASGKTKPGDFSFTEWLRGLSEWLPANSEKLARTHSFVMGYIVARDLMVKNGQRLTQEQMRRFAQQFTNKTMYMYSAADKPKVLTSPVGSGLGLFKNWMFNYIASMGQYSKEAFMHGNVGPLAWQTAGTFALGGLSATPIYWAANQFSQAFTGNDALTTVYDELGDKDAWLDPADGIMYGLPAMLTGASFYSQVQAPGSNPARDAVSLFDSVLWNRFQAISTAFGGAFDHWQATGNHPGSDATVRLQMARAFAPATLYRAMSVGADGSIASGVTGYPIKKNMSAYEQVLYRLKLNPVDLDKAMAVSNKLYEKREERRAAVAQLGEAFTNAQIKGDSAEMALVMQQDGTGD